VLARIHSHGSLFLHCINNKNGGTRAKSPDSTFPENALKPG
jgi:hypothetical protein